MLEMVKITTVWSKETCLSIINVVNYLFELFWFDPCLQFSGWGYLIGDVQGHMISLGSHTIWKSDPIQIKASPSACQMKLRLGKNATWWKLAYFDFWANLTFPFGLFPQATDSRAAYRAQAKKPEHHGGHFRRNRWAWRHPTLNKPTVWWLLYSAE